jgi:hypothetical protein
MDASSDDATRGLIRPGLAADIRSSRADRNGRTSASRDVIDGRYLVLRRIGSGATSAVYCAKRTAETRRWTLEEMRDAAA